MQQDNVISALIGLVGACNNKPKTENTNGLVLSVLASSSDDSETDLIEQIRAEKNVIAPGCATCATPCGNTSDYNMSRIYNAEPTLRDLKLQALAEIRQLATNFLQKGASLTDENTHIFYKALSYVSYDVSEQTLNALIEEIQQTKLQFTDGNDD